MHILDAVTLLRPGTKWNLSGNSLTQAIDDSPRVSVPTWEEIQTILDRFDYYDKRAVAYPPIGDQLDALWKGGQAADDMRAVVNAVKTQYPKPE